MVGLSTDIPLSRRVQLAVLAHIRHTHTRYDNLLRETTWQNARKVVESLCLDTLVKWRGDEETGRDQLDEILREVVVISDSEDDEDSDQDSDDSSVQEVEPPPRPAVPLRVESIAAGQAVPARRRTPKPAANGQNGPLTPARAQAKVKKRKRKTSAEKKGQRGFKRYHAWQEALRRYREENSQEPPSAPMDRRPSQHSYVVQQQLAARPAILHAPVDFRHDSEPRMSAPIAGPAPTENGYVAQPPSYAQHAMNISRRSYSPLQRAPAHDKVMSPREVHRDSPGSRRPVSLVTSRLQDMLVPSIEPASPEAMRPSFVRAVQPRGQDGGTGSPRGTGMQYSPRRLSPPRAAPLPRGEPVVVARRVVQRELAAPGEAYADQRWHTSHVSLDQGFVSSRDGYPLPSSPLYRSVGLPLESSQAPIMVPARRPLQEPLISGERPNTILMEDRGGFFERVDSRPDGAHPSRTTRVVEFRPHPTHDVRRVPEPRRVVSLQEGPRIIRDGPSSPGVRFMQTAGGSPSQSYGREPHLVLAEPALIRPRTPIEMGHAREVEREHHPIFRQPSRPESRSMSRSRLVAQPEPYREVYVHSASDGETKRPTDKNRQYNTQPVSAPRHDQPAQQRYQSGPPPDNHNNHPHQQHTPRRGFPLHPHRPEDVIVIE